MKTNNMIICTVAAVILIALLGFAAYSMMNPTVDENNSTEINVTINNTNNTTNETVTKTPAKTTKKSSDDEIYYDEELNEYFDSNGRTVYDGQFEKGTSKSEIKEALAEIERETNYE